MPRICSRSSAWVSRRGAGMVFPVSRGEETTGFPNLDFQIKTSGGLEFPPAPTVEFPPAPVAEFPPGCTFTGGLSADLFPPGFIHGLSPTTERTLTAFG